MIPIVQQIVVVSQVGRHYKYNRSAALVDTVVGLVSGGNNLAVGVSGLVVDVSGLVVDGDGIVVDVPIGLPIDQMDHRHSAVFVKRGSIGMHINVHVCLYWILSPNSSK